MNLKDEQDSAKKNYDRLASNIPFQLSKREDGFAVQIQRAKLSPAKKLKSLYSFMNELYTFASKYTPCKKGCSSCCHYKVSISEIEIAHIENHTKIKRNEIFNQSENFHGTPCTFLKNGACSIYEVRPFVCRRHVTLAATNTWCNPEISNDETFPLLRFSGIDDAYDHIRRESESFELHDIRQVFGRATHKNSCP
jgi:uncharacterized protein